MHELVSTQQEPSIKQVSDEEIGIYKKLLELPVNWGSSWFSFEEGEVPAGISGSQDDYLATWINGAALGGMVVAADLSLESVLEQCSTVLMRIESKQILDSMYHLLLLDQESTSSLAAFQSHYELLFEDRDSYLEPKCDDFCDFLSEKWGEALLVLDLGEGGSKLAIFSTE